MSVHKIQTLGNHPKERIQHSCTLNIMFFSLRFKYCTYTNKDMIYWNCFYWFYYESYWSHNFWLMILALKGERGMWTLNIPWTHEVTGVFSLVCLKRAKIVFCTAFEGWYAHCNIHGTKEMVTVQSSVPPVAVNRCYSYSVTLRGADKSLAWPGRKQATAPEDFEFHLSYLEW